MVGWLGFVGLGWLVCWLRGFVGCVFVGLHCWLVDVLVDSLFNWMVGSVGFGGWLGWLGLSVGWFVLVG